MPKTDSNKRTDLVDAYVGNRIKMQRIIQGKSQKDIADQLGISFQQLQKYERGVNRIGAGRLYEIASALDVEAGWFFEGFDTVNDDKPKSSQIMIDTEDKQFLALVRAYKDVPNGHFKETVIGLVKSMGTKHIGDSG